jgi:hypothetical protein
MAARRGASKTSKQPPRKKKAPRPTRRNAPVGAKEPITRVRRVVSAATDPLVILFPDPGAPYDLHFAAYGTFTGGQDLKCKITDPTGQNEIDADVTYPADGQWLATFPFQQVPFDGTFSIRNGAGLVVKMNVNPSGFSGDTVSIQIPRPGQSPTLDFAAQGRYTGNNQLTGKLFDQNMNLYANSPVSITGGSDGTWSITFVHPPGQVFVNTTLQVCDAASPTPVCASMTLNPAL